MINLHTHIIPNVDDGSKSIEESLEIIRGLAQQGFTDIVATPHYINSSKYTVSKARNATALVALRQRIQKAKIRAKLYLGNEIYIDSNIAELVKRGKVSALAGSKTLLVELPMSGDYTDYEDILLSLTYSGYTVILAHP